MRSDAIVFATVAALSERTDGSGLIDVALKDVTSVRSRWNLKANPLTGFAVKGKVAADGDSRQVALGTSGQLRKGARYMLMLQGGRWSGHGPFPTGGTSILEVGPDGYIACGGSGYLYAITNRNFVCGRPDDYAVSPLTESDLQAELKRVVSIVARARPNLERQLVRTQLPLQYMP
jgi:hypothetical protein